MKNHNLEIERKFLVEVLPEGYDNNPKYKITQGYFVDQEGKNVRLRKMGDSYFKTNKKGQGLVREEIETTITEEEFEKLWPLTQGRRLEKTRYKIPCGDWTIELDIYHSNLKGLYTAEVEFNSEDEAKSFIPPDWFGKELTNDSRYSNSSLAKFGLPE